MGKTIKVDKKSFSFGRIDGARALLLILSAGFAYAILLKSNSFVIRRRLSSKLRKKKNIIQVFNENIELHKREWRMGNAHTHK